MARSWYGKCPQCGNYIRGKAILAGHIKRVHPNPLPGQRKMAECPHCRRRRSFIVGLKYPGTDNPETAWVCGMCYSKEATP